MKLYSNKTVADYILGNDLDGFDIDTLEDNVDFMMNVIRMSRDKEMYHLCSDKVKNNPSFVRLIINMFSKDEAFVTEVANEFLNKSSDNVARTEVLIMMTKNLSKDSSRCLEYAAMLLYLKVEKAAMIAATRDEYKDDPEQLSYIGATGFSLIYEEFSQSEIVTDYFAEKAIETVLHTDSSEFEDILHKWFKSPQDLDNVNIKSFLIDYISNYDSALSTYISSHIETLKDALTAISSLKAKWDTYSKRVKIKKYNIMFEFIHRYMEEHGSNCSYTEDELLYSIGKELGIIEDIYKHDFSMPHDLSYEEELPNISKIENGVMSYDDLLHYNSLKAIILNFSRANSFKDLEDLEKAYLNPTDDNSAPNVIDFRTVIKRQC